MEKIFLGFLLGTILTIIILKFNEICCVNVFTEEFLKFFIPIVIAAVAGIVALYQVRSNVLVSYRIRWIENFKLNLSEYISETHLALSCLSVYSSNKEKYSNYYDKFFDAINKSSMYRNRIFLELDNSIIIHSQITAKMVEINQLLDKYAEEQKEEIKLQVSGTQNQLEKLISELLKSELEKSKKIFRL